MWGKSKEDLSEIDEPSDVEALTEDKHPLLQSYRNQGSREKQLGTFGEVKNYVQITNYSVQMEEEHQRAMICMQKIVHVENELDR